MGERNRYVRATASLSVAVVLAACTTGPDSAAPAPGAGAGGDPGVTAAEHAGPGRAEAPSRPQDPVAERRRQARLDEAVAVAVRRSQATCRSVVADDGSVATRTSAPEAGSVERALHRLQRCVRALDDLERAHDATHEADLVGLERATTAATQLRSLLEAARRDARGAPPPAPRGDEPPSRPGDDDDEAEARAERIRRSAERLEALVGDLRDRPT